jgi:hypothetical protein
VTIHFTREQIEYLMRVTSSKDPEEAMEIFSLVIKEEGIDPSRMTLYLDKLLERDKGR